jgi:hypothetical protein
MPEVDESRPRWRKSSHSADAGGNCVEIAVLPDGVAMRDSHDPRGPVLVFTAQQWRDFIADVRTGAMDT